MIKTLYLKETVAVGEIVKTVALKEIGMMDEETVVVHLGKKIPVIAEVIGMMTTFQNGIKLGQYFISLLIFIYFRATEENEEKGGSFDAAGAFHAPGSSSEDEAKELPPEKVPTKENSTSSKDKEVSLESYLLKYLI